MRTGMTLHIPVCDPPPTLPRLLSGDTFGIKGFVGLSAQWFPRNPPPFIAMNRVRILHACPLVSRNAPWFGGISRIHPL